MAASQTIFRPSWQDLQSGPKIESKKSDIMSPHSTPKLKRTKTISSPSMSRLRTNENDAQGSPNLQRREGAKVYDYVERKMVFKFLTETVSARYKEEEEATESSKSSIFESPKMYRRFGNLEKYHS